MSHIFGVQHMYSKIWSTLAEIDATQTASPVTQCMHYTPRRVSQPLPVGLVWWFVANSVSLRGTCRVGATLLQ